MASAGYAATLKVGGTPVAMSSEACTTVTTGLVYQVTSTSRRIISPAAAVAVGIDADGPGAGGFATATATAYTVDYLFGKFTFGSTQGASATANTSAEYIPTLTIAEVTKWELSASRTVLDTTSMDSAGYHSRLASLFDLSGSITFLANPSTDLDSGAGTTKLATLFTGGTPLLLEIRPLGTSGDYFRAWVSLSELSESGAVDGLVEYSANLTLAAQKGLNRTDYAGYGWGQ